jgi:hypothetical protein
VETGVDRGGGAELGVLGVGYRTLHIKICVFRYVRHPTALAFTKQTMTRRMHGGMDERIQHDRSKPSREADIFLGPDVKILKLGYRHLHLGARVCSFPFVLSEPEDLKVGTHL